MRNAQFYRLASLLFFGSIAYAAQAQENYVIPPSDYYIIPTVDDPTKWLPHPVPGTVQKTASRTSRMGQIKSGQISLITLRGWLRKVDTNANWDDPDFHYNLEVDPTSTDLIGASLQHVLSVGNISADFVEDRDPDYVYVCAARPVIHMELHGWPWHQNAYTDDPDPTGWQPFYSDRGWPQNVLWPFPPGHPDPNHLEIGFDQLKDRYVEVTGSLITDEPHANSNPFADHIKQRQAFWDAWTDTDWGPVNSARWVEIHSPDKIRILPDKGYETGGTTQRGLVFETVRGVALGKKSELFSGSSTMDYDIPAPPLNLRDGESVVTLNPHLEVQEIVLPGTNWRSIRDGNGIPGGNDVTDTGARITVHDADVNNAWVHIHVKVESESVWGANGKFAALYRVYWAPAMDLFVDHNYFGPEEGTALRPYSTVTVALIAAQRRPTNIYVRTNGYNERPFITKKVNILNWGNSGTVRIGAP